MEKKKGEVYVKCHVASAVAAQRECGETASGRFPEREANDGEDGDEGF